MSEPDSSGPARTVTVSFDLSRLPGVGTALGVALVSSAVLLSAYYSRDSGDLDGSTYTMGLLAVVGLLGVAAGAHLLVADAERRASLVSWPGAAGVVGAGVMLGVLVDDDPASTYGAGALILLVSAAAYAGTRAAPFALSTLVGLTLLYVQAFSDLFGAEGDDETSFITVGAGLLFFVGAVTAVGWLLPRTRVLTAAVVGAGAIAVFAGLFSFIAVFASFSTAFADGSSGLEYSGSYEQLEGSSTDDYYDEGFPSSAEAYAEDVQVSPYRNDLQVMLAFSGVLALFWAACAVASGHVVFRILSVSILVISIPAVAVGLVTQHPTWWQVVVTAVGGLLLAGVAYRQHKAGWSEPAT